MKWRIFFCRPQERGLWFVIAPEGLGFWPIPFATAGEALDAIRARLSTLAQLQAH